MRCIFPTLSILRPHYVLKQPCGPHLSQAKLPELRGVKLSGVVDMLHRVSGVTTRQADRCSFSNSYVAEADIPGISFLLETADRLVSAYAFS